MRVARVASVAGVLLLLAGCTGGPTPEPTPSSSPLGCESAWTMTASGPEIEGAAQDGTSLYGLVMAEQWPLHASDSVVKIVWRMTGSGDLAVVVESPSGEHEQLAWGPEPHGGSNYDRPGDEWGTGLVMNAPGCWHLTFTRSARGSANVWLSVSP